MIVLKISCLLHFVLCTLALAAQKVPASVIKEVEQAEARMFANMTYSHAKEYVKTDIADDYFSINADGTTMTKDSILADSNIPFLKMMDMATYKFFDRKIRVHGNVGITTGRAQAFANGVLGVEFLYTTIFVKQKGKWMYTGWHGTLSRNSPPPPPMPGKQ